MTRIPRRAFLKSMAALWAGAVTRGLWAAPRQLPPGVKRLFAPRDAAAAALADMLSIDRRRQPYTWYVWDNIGTKESAAALNFCVNAVLSQASTIVQPAKTAGGRLLRYDLTELAPRRAEFERLWLELQNLAEF